MHPDRPPIEPAASPVRVERVGAISWRFAAALGLVIGLIAIAILKPWGALRSPALDTGHRLPSSSSQESAQPSPSADAELVAALHREQCTAPPQWRLLTMEFTAIGDSRTMYGAAAAEATGPADPSIPTVHLRAIRLYGIGLCRPNPSGRPVIDTPLEGFTLWQVPPGGEPARIVGFSTLDQQLFRLGEGYFGPPPAEIGSAQPTEAQPVWQPGRYVFQIDQPADAGHSLWLALDFSKPDTAAAPTSRPTGSPAGNDLSR